MSTEGIEAKKQQMEDYILFHPDAVTVTVAVSLVQFPALYDNATITNNRDGANVQQRKPVPHLTIYSEHADSVKRGDSVSFNGITKTVNVVKTDRTETTYQAEIWLV
jgi:hypothetical protein